MSNFTQMSWPFLLAVALGSGRVLGQGAESAGDSSRVFQRDETTPNRMERVSLVYRATELLGKKMKEHSSFRTLGKLEDLLLDFASSEVVAGLVSVGSDAHVTAVPPHSFFAARKDWIAFRGEHKTFDNAPRFNFARSATGLDPKAIGDALHYFAKGAPADIANCCSSWISAAGFLGFKLVDQENRPLGLVEDIVVDVPLGRLVYIVVRPAAASAGTDLYPLAPTVLRADVAAGVAMVKCDAAHFLAGPHFPRQFWADIARPELGAEVLGHYGLLPSNPAEDPSRKPMRTPARSDHEIKQAVMLEFTKELAAGGFGISMPPIAVEPLNGRVTLAGSLKSSKQKSRLLAAAERVVGPGNVIDQLEAKGK